MRSEMFFLACASNFDIFSAVFKYDVVKLSPLYTCFVPLFIVIRKRCACFSFSSILFRFTFFISCSFRKYVIYMRYEMIFHLTKTSQNGTSSMSAYFFLSLFFSSSHHAMPLYSSRIPSVISVLRYIRKCHFIACILFSLTKFIRPLDDVLTFSFLHILLILYGSFGRCDA